MEGGGGEWGRYGALKAIDLSGNVAECQNAGAVA